jgi:hypothetical protein
MIDTPFKVERGGVELPNGKEKGGCC